MHLPLLTKLGIALFAFALLHRSGIGAVLGGIVKILFALFVLGVLGSIGIRPRSSKELLDEGPSVKISNPRSPAPETLSA